MSKLWVLHHSKVLGGFYQSQVVIIANDLEEAVEKGMEALNARIRDHLEDGLSFEISNGDIRERVYIDAWDEDDFNRYHPRILSEMRKELEQKLEEVEAGFLISVSN